MRRLVLGAALAAALFGLAAVGGIARPDGALSAEPPARTLSVVGDGSVTAVPDTAGFVFGVVTQAKTASEALATNSAAAAKLVAALRGAGVAAADLQTQQVSLQPRYDDRNPAAIVGYEAQTSVSATIRALARSGAVVDAAVAAGADQVSGPSLTSAARTTLYRQALADAYADAKAKAEALAAKFGASLGHALEVTEQGATPPTPLAAGRADVATKQQVEPGTEEIVAQLGVTFALS